MKYSNNIASITILALTIGTGAVIHSNYGISRTVSESFDMNIQEELIEREDLEKEREQFNLSSEELKSLEKHYYHYVIYEEKSSDIIEATPKQIPAMQTRESNFEVENFEFD